MKRTLFALIALASGAVVRAQEPAAQQVSLTVAQAVERALAASASLEQAHALERAAASDARAARASRLPQLGVSAGYTRQSDVPELVLAFPGAAPRTIFPNIPDNYRTRLEASLPLYTGGRTAGAIAASARESAAAGSDVAAARADLVLETTAAYWSLVTARESARVVTEGLTAYDAHLQDARNHEQMGMAARNDVLSVAVERERAELARLRAANASAVAAANLLRLLDLPAGTELVLDEPLQAGAPPQPALDALLSAALAQRPERAALASRVAAAEARIAAERGARLPQVGVAAGYDYSNPNRRILPPVAEWKTSWDVSVSVSLNLFDGGRVAAAEARATARAEAARHQLEDLDRRIRLQVTQRLLELSAAEAAAVVAERALEAAAESRRVASDRHRAGVIASSALLDAEVALLRAGLERTDALAQVRLARASLDRAAGR
jgi:outer membrane protein TolC